MTSRPPLFLQIQQEFYFLPDSLVTIGITGFSVCLDDTLVEDESILFDMRHNFDKFVLQIPLKIIVRHHIQGVTMVQRVV